MKLILATLLFVVGLATSSAWAELMVQPATVLCGPADELRSILTDEYGEKLVQQGTVTGNEFMAQLWRNPTTLTWSFLILNTGGGACIYAAGDIWDGAPPLPIDPASTY